MHNLIFLFSFFSILYMRCMVPFMKISMSKFPSDRDDLSALKMSLSRENKHSTAALEQMSVLNMMNKFTNICWLKKATSVNKSLELVSNQVLTKFWVLPLSVLQFLLLSFGWVTSLKKSSSLSLLLPLPFVRLLPRGLLHLILHAFPHLNELDTYPTRWGKTWSGRQQPAGIPYPPGRS